MGWLPLLFLACTVQFHSGAASYLLPSNLLPRHYDLRLLYDIDPQSNFSFFGVVDILLTVKIPTSKIVLHVHNLQFAEDDINLYYPKNDSESPNITSLHINEKYDFLTLKLDGSMKLNENYTLTIPFYGNLGYGLDGAYVSTYNDLKTDKKEYLIATQFEAISARKAFPCFDEPIYKATYTLTIGHHRDYSAISNMPLYETTMDSPFKDYWPWSQIMKKVSTKKFEFVYDWFETSVPMSTYLVAFVISKFGYVESYFPSSETNSSSTKFRIWARKDAADQTSYAAKIGPRILKYYEEYFQVPFPLPKQDMVAIPDFAAGAMENWGIITYRETALLYDRQKSSFVAKERVAEVIAHELAHQWFGNLVTMKWWSDLWLNEGFATYMASVGTANVEPEWNAVQNNAVQTILNVLRLDAMESSHPVSVPLDDPKRISEIFDTISYQKGSALIRMMTMFLGENVFREALTQYLNKYAYSNAEQDDLWEELTEVSVKWKKLPKHTTVKDIMDTWTTQTGVPLLTVTRHYDEMAVTVHQTRLIHATSTIVSNSSWWIPLRIMTASDVRTPLDTIVWLAKDQGIYEGYTMNWEKSPEDWVLFNPDMIAPYRINYDLKNWQMLTQTLVSTKYRNIPLLGRVQLLSDVFWFAWNNVVTYDVALELATYLHREIDYLPLETALRSLEPIDKMLQKTSGYGAFQKFMRKLIHKQYEHGGLAKKMIVNKEDLDSVKMQILTSNWACRVKVPGCEENAIDLFNSWMETENPDWDNPIPLDLRRTVYCVALRRGSVAEWRFAFTRMQRSNVAAERAQLQSALTCTRELWLLIQYLEWAIENDSHVVRQQDAPRVIANIASSSIGFYVAKDFIYTRVKDIYKVLGGQGRRMGGLIKALLGEFTKQAQLDEFLAWREKNAQYLDGAQLAVSQAIEAAEVNIRWLERNQVSIVEKLREYSTPDAKATAKNHSRKRKRMPHKHH